jgi:hypothetical protein
MTDTHKQVGGQVVQCSSTCPKNSPKSTLLLLLRVAEAKKVKALDLFDRCEMSITIVGVQYLYPRPGYESWSNKTNNKYMEKK